MKRNFYALLAIFALALSIAQFSFANNEEGAAENASQPTGVLAAMLPASDAVVTLDLQRLINVAVPQVLSGKPQEITKINAGIDKFKNDTGLDLRQFEQVAIGLAVKQTAPQQLDFDPVMMARGKFSPAALLAIAKAGVKGKYREEKFGDKTIYVFSPKEIFPNNKPKTPAKSAKSKMDKMFERMSDKLSNEMAFAVFDDNTLAIGTVARVREALDGKTRISPEVLNFVNAKPNAVLSFGANMPQGMAQFVDLENDEIGKNLKEIRQIYGSMDAGGGNAMLSLAAKTLKPETAQSLEEMLAGLQMVGKGFLGGAKGEDKKVLARMIENVKIARSANQITLDLQVPQSDINLLLGAK